MASVETESTTNMEVSQVNANATIVGAVSNHRKMIAVPALKILQDPDHSDKSFLVLLSGKYIKIYICLPPLLYLIMPLTKNEAIFKK